jgi:hypothetical protein
MQKEEMLYNGTTLTWYGQGVFRATSGLPGHQIASDQSLSDVGPIPEGRFSFPLALAKDATMIGPGVLDLREGIEHIDSVLQYRGAGWRNVAWGADRVRLSIETIDDPRNRGRGGFYLHDSTKGYSHGCIEVDPRFFLRLRGYVKLPSQSRGGRTRLYLKVKYPSPQTITNGGTLVR